MESTNFITRSPKAVVHGCSKDTTTGLKVFKFTDSMMHALSFVSLCDTRMMTT